VFNYRLLTRISGGFFSLAVSMLVAMPAFASSITLATPLGEIVIDLFEEETPETVANFLNYVRDGDFENSFIHRSVTGFIIQGGGFTWVDGALVNVPTDPPVINEPGISNLRGTIAMAKRSGDPNSATSQWFINLADNAAILDDQNGGFTVFGEVTGDGMDVADAIAALQIWNAGGTFSTIPLIDYPGSPTPIAVEYLVMTDLSENDEFQINPGLNDAWYNITTNGQGFFIIVFPDLEQMFLTWFTFDTERPPESVTAMLGDPGARWLTAQGSYSGNQAVLEITMTTGGIFDSGTPVPVSNPDGTIVVEFSDCAAGTVSYDIPSINSQGVVPIQRIVLDNIALCEQLAEPVAQ